MLAKPRHHRASTITAIEELRACGEITEAHAVGITAFAPVFTILFGSMTPAQRTNADTVFRSDDRKPHRKAS